MIRRLRLVVLISGTGSNLKAILTAIHEQRLDAQICAVISNKASAAGLAHALAANIPIHVLAAKDFPTREAYDNALLAQIEPYAPDLVVLAGFMRILSAPFVQALAGKVLNIHPSLLPNYPGLDTHARVLAAGDPEHGISIHFVTAALDQGPIICQSKCQVQADHTPQSLAERIHQLEHLSYPQVLQWFAQNRVQLKGETVYLDGHALGKQGCLI